MELDQDKLRKIRNLLKLHQKGLSITEISSRLKLNRNSVAKYLELLSISGQVEMHSYGSAKVFYLSQRIPLSAILNFSSDLVLILDNDWKIIQINDQFLQFFEEKRENIIGKEIQEVPVDFVRNLPVEEVMSQDKTEGETITEKETVIRGEPHYFRIKFIPSIFDDGSEGLTIILEDISKDKWHERELQINEARYRAIVEDQTELITRFRGDGTLTFVNESCCRYFNRERGELVGFNMFSLIPEEDREFVKDQFTSITCEHPVITLEHRVMHPELGIRWQQWTNRGICDDDGQIIEYQGTGRDVSDRRVAEEKASRYAAEMKFLSKTAMSFVRVTDETDIYRIIGENLRPITPPDAIIMLESYERSNNTVTIRAVMDENVREELISVLKRDPVGMVFPNEESLGQGLRAGSFIHLTGKLKIGDIFIFGLISDHGDFFGHAIILCRTGKPVENTGIISAYLNQASIAVQRDFMEVQLRKSEEQFRNVAELSPFPVSIIDASDRYVYLNGSFLRTFGYSIEDIPNGEAWFSLAFPDPELRRKAKITWKTDLARALPGEVRPRIFPVVTKTGNSREVLFRPVKMSDGRHFVLYEDITERQKSEKTRNLLASIVQYSDDAIISKAVDGTIMSWNPGAERLFGYDAEEVVGRSIMIIIPQNLHEGELDILDHVRRGEHIADFETLRIRKDGKVLNVSESISPICDENHVVVGASSIVRDITELKAEEKLKETEERYRSLVENINVGVYRSTGDPEGRFVWGNSSLVEILGCDSLEVLQKVPVSELFIIPDGRKELLDKLEKQGFVKNQEIYLRRCDGTPIWVHVTATARFSDTGEIEVITGIVEDITERRKIEQDLQVAQKAIQNLVECTPDPSCAVGEDRKVIAWNRAMEKATGLAKAEVIGRSRLPEVMPRLGIRQSLLDELLDLPPEILKERYPDCSSIRRVKPAESTDLKVFVKKEELEEKICLFYGPDGKCHGGVVTVTPTPKRDS
jgi:PAS domain S-box-containing protein